ncbi:hypothetical protein DEJ23_09985 [Curtobacterium sp. MCSS17_008]|uniref:hypothetical protein n=1 Tax=Curtobacterium sp. MCSS17_008 TaxID=2175647 RepID=UPI000DA7C157|nr:hypothetical protein [Curtobacterium sp. MCSS17_008]PZF56489.1 hypothetical protein DEJ23_09985 [Curtobacterium sp. MCSS17_008]
MNTSNSTRSIAALAIAASAALLLVGCTGGTTMNATPRQTSDEAKQIVVDIVDRSTAAIGGEWTVRSGPAVQACALPSGGSGAAFAYIIDRAAGGDPSADVAILKALWEREGIATEVYKNSGSDPVGGMRGTGGPTTSIDLYADPKGYTVEGLSVCTEGDAAEMQRNGE